jgi:DNA-binding NtrC family response regulator
MPNSSVLLREAKLVYRSAAFRKVLREAESAALADDSVLLEGESGTGKRRVAEIIHNLSARKGRPLKVWNAAETAPALALADLFGVAKGAFTGADRDAPGILDAAQGGSVLVDDVDKMHPDTQKGLLRFLDDSEYRAVGSAVSKEWDGRLLFATNRNLLDLARRGAFLPDLANRLCVLTLLIPPLRSRPEDIAPLARYFAKRISERNNRPCPAFSQEALRALEGDEWRGNVRELVGVIQNLVHRAERGRLIGDSVVRAAIQLLRSDAPSLDQETLGRLKALPLAERCSRQSVQKALEIFRNGRAAARALGIPERTFRRYISKYGLTRTPGLKDRDLGLESRSLDQDWELGTRVP